MHWTQHLFVIPSQPFVYLVIFPSNCSEKNLSNLNETKSATGIICQIATRKNLANHTITNSSLHSEVHGLKYLLSGNFSICSSDVNKDTVCACPILTFNRGVAEPSSLSNRRGETGSSPPKCQNLWSWKCRMKKFQCQRMKSMPSFSVAFQLDPGVVKVSMDTK